MSKVTFDWHGDQLVDRVERAAREAVNETVDEARDDAAASHAWVNRTDQLEEEIVSEHDETPGPNPQAFFGTTRRRGFYGLFHELGTKNEYSRPFLRPAADRHFGTLASRIREKLK